MVSLHLEFDNAKDMREYLLILLGIPEHPLAFQHAEPVKVVTQPGEFQTVRAPIGSVTVPAESTPITNIPTAEPEASRKLRGRPRKVAEPELTQTLPPQPKAPEPASSPTVAATEALSALQTSPVTMFDAPAPTGTPVPSTPVVPTPAPSTVTFEQVKEALQKVAAVRPTDTNEMAGLNRATEIIGKVQTGCRKIKDIKPENYAAVLAACLTA
jgi:hypothetical protein